jgi:hypothetical protein
VSSIIDFFNHPVVDLVLGVLAPFAWVWIGFTWGKGHDKRMLRKAQKESGATFDGEPDQCPTMMPYFAQCQRRRDHENWHLAELGDGKSLGWARGSFADDWPQLESK